MKKTIWKAGSICLLIMALAGIQTTLMGQLSVAGRVLDGETRSPLPYANVHGLYDRSITDLQGRFRLESQTGADTLRISYVGFNPVTLPVSLTGEPLEIGDIYLTSLSEQLNTVTITSGKFKKRIQDVTVSMEILQPGLLERNHVQSFSDILDKIPGVNYVDGQVNIRGGSGYSYGAGSRVLLLIDNIPALSSDAAFANWTDIPVETIAQVEIIKGAGSALYGSAAMNGVINILTRYAKNETRFDIQAQSQLFLAPSDTSRMWWTTPPYRHNISSSFSRKFGDLSVVAAGFMIREDSYQKDSYNNYGRLNLKLDYAFRENLVAGISSNFNTGKSRSFFYWKNENAGAYLADPVNYTTGNKLRFTIDPRVTYYGDREQTHRFNGRIYRVANESDNDQSNYMTSFYGEYQFQKKWPAAGLSATSGWVSQYAIVKAPLYGDTSFTSMNHALYLQMEKRFFEKLTMNAGGRFEMNKINGPSSIGGLPVLPDSIESLPVFRLGLNYKLFSFTNLRASFGQGYRYPSIAEKYISTAAGILNIVPNPNLERETGWTAELGVRQGLALGQIQGFVDLSAFESQYDNMIEFNIQLGTFPPKFSAQNIGDTRIRGLEFSTGLQADLGPIKWEVQGGYVFIDPVYRNFNDTIRLLSSSEENILKYRNRHSLKFNTQLGFRGFSAGIGSEYQSFMEAIDAVFNELIPGVKNFRQLHDQGTQVWYAHLGYSFPHWSLSLRMDNLLNETYTVRPAQLEAPRSLSLKVKYQL
jgi:iron complex outermembrane receptor protein